MIIQVQGRALSTGSHHEVVNLFADHGWGLNESLTLMLDEHFTHRTERRGCGFTQSSRHVAEFINRPRHPSERDEFRLFAERHHGLFDLMQTASELGVELAWRELDQSPPPDGLRGHAPACGTYMAESRRLARLRSLIHMPLLEESALITRMIVGCVLPESADHSPTLTPWPHRLEIGTCPLAERYFLEVAGAFVRRKGVVNVIVSEEGAPLLIEKMGLGDDHSCISLVPLRLNEVRIPPGSLLGVRYEGDPGLRANRNLPGKVIPLSSCQGFRFLRLTTLAVSPENRPRAFSSHFEAQVAGGLFAPGETTVEDILREAERQV